jgi:hypothetical protein
LLLTNPKNNLVLFDPLIFKVKSTQVRLFQPKNRLI